MHTAKDIRIAPISAKDANALVKRVHYSGKVATTSRLHFGVFLDGRLEGAMSYGDSIDKRKVISLVRDTHWRGFLELNRLAFTDNLPRNSESRALSISFKMIKKNYPHIEWILSFADGCQCGDGTIYRASGFALTAIKKNSGMWKLPNGDVVADIITRQVWNESTRKRMGFAMGERWSDYAKRVGATKLPGFQLRYIYFLNPKARERLTVPIIPFSRIDEMGAGMYRGEKRSKQAMDATSVTAMGQHQSDRSTEASHA